MIYPGVDIVYLPHALLKKRSTDKRYREIVFNPSEQRFVEESSKPEITIHILWALKEAAYKANVLRTGDEKRFIPHDITILELSETAHNSIAEVDGFQVELHTKVADDYAFAWVQNTQYQIHDVGELPKMLVYDFLSEKKVEIENKIEGQNALFSYSHDGNYAAIGYSIYLM